VNEGAIYKLIPLVSRDVGSIAKARKNKTQGFDYRGIDDVLDAFHGPLAKHGVFVAPSYTMLETTERQTKNGGVQFVVRVSGSFAFYASDGSSVVAAALGEAMDSGDKAVGKAMSVALKYAMFQVFMIPVSGVMEDADDDTPEETLALTPDEQKAAECLRNCTTQFQLQEMWSTLDKPMKASLAHIKDAQKKKLGLA
jgi:hypothetical protein